MPQENGPLCQPQGVQLEGLQHFPEAGRTFPSSRWWVTKALPRSSRPHNQEEWQAGTRLALETTSYFHPILAVNITPAQTSWPAILQKGQGLGLGDCGPQLTRRRTGVQPDPGMGASSEKGPLSSAPAGHILPGPGQGTALRNPEGLCYLCVSRFSLQKPSGCYHCHC